MNVWHAKKGGQCSVWLQRYFAVLIKGSNLQLRLTSVREVGLAPLGPRASRLESTEDTISTLLLETSYYSTTKTNPVWLKGPQDMSYLADGSLWNRLYSADLLNLFCKLYVLFFFFRFTFFSFGWNSCRPACDVQSQPWVMETENRKRSVSQSCVITVELNALHVLETFGCRSVDGLSVQHSLFIIFFIVFFRLFFIWNCLPEITEGIISQMNCFDLSGRIFFM